MEKNSGGTEKSGCQILIRDRGSIDTLMLAGNDCNLDFEIYKSMRQNLAARDSRFLHLFSERLNLLHPKEFYSEI